MNLKKKDNIIYSTRGMPLFRLKSSPIDVSRCGVNIFNGSVNLGFLMDVFSNKDKKKRLVNMESEARQLVKVIQELKSWILLKSRKATSKNLNEIELNLNEIELYLKCIKLPKTEYNQEEINFIVKRIENIYDKIVDYVRSIIDVEQGFNESLICFKYEEIFFHPFSKENYLEKENYEFACLLSFLSPYLPISVGAEKLAERYETYSNRDNLLNKTTGYLFTHWLERLQNLDNMSIIGFVSALKWMQFYRPKILEEALSSMGLKFDEDSIIKVADQIFHIVNEKVSHVFYLFEALSSFEQSKYFKQQNINSLFILKHLGILNDDDFNHPLLKPLYDMDYPRSENKIKGIFDTNVKENLTYCKKEIQVISSPPKSWLYDFSYRIGCDWQNSYSKRPFKHKDMFEVNKWIVDTLTKRLKESRNEILHELRHLIPVFIEFTKR